ncbi:MAG: hypothetical protein H7Z42_14860 [Roseiflexaceae bacterium]|nr:hypothetical protein [Roseiflexaceae bacterium]
MSNEHSHEPGGDAAPASTSAALFYVWYDDTPRKQTSDKIDEAITGYIARFAMRPSHVLVNSVDLVGRSDLIISSGRTVQPNTFWLSTENTAALSTV